MKMVHEELVFPGLTASNYEEVIKLVGSKMCAKGFVKDSYVDAVLEREKVFPTGLQIGDFGIAIPHTDSKHVEKSMVGIATLKDAVIFQSMVDPSTEVAAKLVFLLAVKDPDGQMEMLKQLMSIFQNIILLEALWQESSPQKMAELLIDLKLTPIQN